MTFEDKAKVVIAQLRADRDRLQGALDKIRSEIEQFAKNPNFGDLSLGASCGAMKALEIIDKYMEERSE